MEDTNISRDSGNSIESTESHTENEYDRDNASEGLKSNAEDTENEIISASDVIADFSGEDEKSKGKTNNAVLTNSLQYMENIKEPQQKKNISIVQLIALALVSSILGAFIFGAVFFFLGPNLLPSVKSFINSSAQASGSNAATSGNTKQMEIVQGTTDSPVAAIAEKVGPAVVGIQITMPASGNYFFQTQQQGEGSGVIIRDNGYIMTNYHVVSDVLDPNNPKSIAQGSKIEVFLPASPDKPYTATYVGGDSKTDLAVIKIDATNLPVVELGDSDKLKVGELTVAIGNPGGLELAGTVTTGVISGLNRTISDLTGSALKLIQTDAAISPGNSGGALVNSQGQVIGINEMKIAAQGFEGLGFAIPVNLAKTITDQLITNKYVPGRPYLGLSINNQYTEDVAAQYNLPAGAYVSDVDKTGPSSAAGIQAKDIITKINGTVVKGYSDLDTEKSKFKPGDTVTLEIYRRSSDGNSAKTLTVQVKLAESKN
ncbi:MAG: trypsin-like peptidase domain-containing protein [Clostridiales bacterium]|nr:trypsin-like peptidase domain-containing protein [Eubacteriales bacterium]MDH7566602.1 trypsin-like peptidase domain-containing protein [Clostridiales bacterium]